VDERYQLLGILSEADCVGLLVDGVYEGLPAAKVKSCMSTSCTTVSEDTDLLTVAHMFLNQGYRGLPVVRGEELMGQVRRHDLLRAFNSVLKEAPVNRAALLYLSAVNESDSGLARQL
jgi:CBS domain-containing protein